MNYIVIDLEWNQCPKGKEAEDIRLPFEIIEIGAVKLNSRRKTVAEFHSVIKPQVYRWIHNKTREIIHLDYSRLKEGIRFPEATRQFFEWCGEDCRFCSWGNQDLMELQRNLKYYHLEGLLPGPMKYYDVQKLFSLGFEDGKSRKSLEYAIDFLELPKTEFFHQALADARYAAAIFKQLEEDCIRRNFSIDVYQNPKSKKEEIHIFYDSYEKFISREFDSKENAIADREVSSTRCPLCQKPAKKKIWWFSVNARRYFSVSACPQHGYIKGKVRMKKTDEGKFYVEKTLSLIDEKDAKRILEKKELLCAKRRMHKKSMQ